MFSFKNLFKKKCSLKSINKEKLDKDISKFNSCGINDIPRTPKLIVSLTSFPQRMYDIHYCLYSLLKQTLKPDMIILWLAEEQFPNKEKDIPQEVLSLQKFGLTIKWCKNLYSYKKLIPALIEYPDDIIVTTDDDVFYEKDCIEKLYKSYLETPGVISCHRGHRIITDANGNFAIYKKWKKKISGESINFKNFFTGVGAVLYPPHSLYKDITNIELFTKLAPHADDIWFWAMAVLNNTPIKVIKNNIKNNTYINPERERGLTGELTLAASNYKKGGNDIQMANVISYYPQIKEIINN